MRSTSSSVYLSCLSPKPPVEAYRGKNVSARLTFRRGSVAAVERRHAPANSGTDPGVDSRRNHRGSRDSPLSGHQPLLPSQTPPPHLRRALAVSSLQLILGTRHVQQSHGAVFLAYFVAQWSRAGRIGALPAAATHPPPPLSSGGIRGGWHGRQGRQRQAGWASAHGSGHPCGCSSCR